MYGNINDDIWDDHEEIKRKAFERNREKERLDNIDKNFSIFQKEEIERNREKIEAWNNSLGYKKEINNVFHGNFDELHMKFLNAWQDKYGVLEDEQIFVLRKYTEFQKTGIIK